MLSLIFKGLQGLIDIIALALSSLVSLLPASPFESLASSPAGDLLSKINFFIPFYDFVAILQAWVLAVGIYYLYSVFARWLKAIQ